jgi:hypothetical protein
VGCVGVFGGCGVCGKCGVCGVCGGYGGVGVWACGRVGSLLTFDIPQTALVATLDTYDFIYNLSEMETFMIGFSLYSNTAKLLNTDPPKGGQHLSCLEGIRFLSMTWVVLGHAFSALIDFQVPNSNLLKLTQVKVPNNSQPKLINETNLVIGL